MKKLVLLVFIIWCAQSAYTAEEYDVSEVYVEMKTGYETYFAEVTELGFGSVLGPKFGQVKKLYRKGRLDDIGHGKYLVRLKWVAEDIFAIDGTPFLLNIKWASRYTFDYEECIYDTAAGYSLYGKVIKR